MNYIFNKIELSLKRRDKEKTELIIQDYPFIGLEIEDSEDIKEFIDSMEEWELTDIEYKKSDDIVFRVFFENDEEGRKNTENLIHRLKKEIDQIDVKREVVDNSNWEEEWKKTYKSFTIGEKILIKPSWEESSNKEKRITIEIDPKMAFGTGTHETTSMCMEYIEDKDLTGKRVLDIGAGSGILSILASKLGAEKIDAVDIDPISIESTKDNAKINGVDNIKAFESNLFSQVEGKYDVIFANILAEILVEMIGQVNEYLTKSGIMVLSGIIEEKKDLVSQALTEHEYEIIEEKIEGEWLMLVARRKDV